jgi:hypothetical protein
VTGYLLMYNSKNFAFNFEATYTKTLDGLLFQSLTEKKIKKAILLVLTTDHITTLRQKALK